MCVCKTSLKSRMYVYIYMRVLFRIAIVDEKNGDACANLAGAFAPLFLEIQFSRRFTFTCSHRGAFSSVTIGTSRRR